MMGEQPGDEPSNDPRSFQAKARWQRALVVLAGPTMNIVLAIVIVTGSLHVRLPQGSNFEQPGYQQPRSRVTCCTGGTAAGR